MQFTELERAVLGLFHEAFAARGFPTPRDLTPRRRQRTELGYFLHLESSRCSRLANWRYPLPADDAVRVFNSQGAPVEVCLYLDGGRPVTLECSAGRVVWGSGARLDWRLDAHNDHYL